MYWHIYGSWLISIWKRVNWQILDLTWRGICATCGELQLNCNLLLIQPHTKQTAKLSIILAAILAVCRCCRWYGPRQARAWHESIINFQYLDRQLAIITFAQRQPNSIWTMWVSVLPLPSPAERRVAVINTWRPCSKSSGLNCTNVATKQQRVH